MVPINSGLGMDSVTAYHFNDLLESSTYLTSSMRPTFSRKSFGRCPPP